jgi:valyl-tRNA synthetase
LVSGINQTPPGGTQTQLIMYKVLEKYLRALHPFMPFITEEIWQKLPGAEGSIMQQPWPHYRRKMINPSYENRMRDVFELINTIRIMRSEMDIGLSSAIRIK